MTAPSQTITNWKTFPDYKKAQKIATQSFCGQIESYV